MMNSDTDAVATGTGRRLLYGIACLFVVVACERQDDLAEERLRPVRYLQVSDDFVVRDRSFSATSKSSLEARLSFKVSGTVTNVPIQIGQRMLAGDLIAEIDAASYSLQAQQANASLVEAQANERRATANYERTKGLYANDNASLNDLDAARAQAESATAVVRAAEKALEISRLNVSYTRLTADTDCSIASIDVEVNENVQAGQQVVSVNCGNEYEVTLDLPESLIGRVDEYTPVSIRFGAISDLEFSGQISEIGVASVGAAAAFPVVIKINEDHPSLRSGLAANVTFQFDSFGSGGVVLPVAAVVHDPGGTFVFVAEPDGRQGEAVVRRRAVDLGELTQSGVEVLQGLDTGDRVITAGVSVIRDGQRVLIPRD